MQSAELFLFSLVVQVPRPLKERLGLPSEQSRTETGTNWLLSMLSPFVFP